MTNLLFTDKAQMKTVAKAATDQGLDVRSVVDLHERDPAERLSVIEATDDDTVAVVAHVPADQRHVIDMAFQNRFDVITRKDNRAVHELVDALA